jgi:hypothetical protein
MDIDGMEHPGILFLGKKGDEVGNIPSVLLRDVHCKD